LRAFRQSKHLSPDDVAKRSGLLRAYISRVEEGNQVPAIATLEKLARAIEVPMYQLFYEGDEPRKSPSRTKFNPTDEILLVNTRRAGAQKTRKHKESSWSQLLLMLHAQEKSDTFNPEPLGKLAEAIVRQGSKSKSKKALQQWLRDNGESWLIGKRPALAAVIEAAARLSLPEIENFFAKVLACKEAEYNVASIAAQRVRLFPIKDVELQIELWRSLRYWIDLWLKKITTEEYAVLAIPSVPVIAQGNAVAWLGELLMKGSNRAAAAGALGILEWLASGRQAEGPSDDILDALSNALIDRFQRESESPSPETDSFPSLVPTVVWTLGATVTKSQLSRVAQIMAYSFQHPRGLEDAAALRAGRLLVKRWHERGIEALAAAFGGCNSEEFSRYNVGLLLGSR